VNDHALTVDVADLQVGQLGVSGAGGVESHEQDALARGACRMKELRDFFSAKNRCRRSATPPGVVLRNSLTICVSRTTRLDIRECVEGLSDPANS
jgi:hypothetical protein